MYILSVVRLTNWRKICGICRQVKDLLYAL